MFSVTQSCISHSWSPGAKNTDHISIRQALKIVTKVPKNEIARNYARAALGLSCTPNAQFLQLDKLPGVVLIGHPDDVGQMMSGNELRCQILYVLNNLKGWRGKEAKRIKDVLIRATI